MLTEFKKMALDIPVTSAMMIVGVEQIRGFDVVGLMDLMWWP